MLPQAAWSPASLRPGGGPLVQGGGRRRMAGPRCRGRTAGDGGLSLRGGHPPGGTDTGEQTLELRVKLQNQAVRGRPCTRRLGCPGATKGPTSSPKAPEALPSVPPRPPREALCGRPGGEAHGRQRLPPWPARPSSPRAATVGHGRETKTWSLPLDSCPRRPASVPPLAARQARPPRGSPSRTMSHQRGHSWFHNWGGTLLMPAGDAVGDAAHTLVRRTTPPPPQSTTGPTLIVESLPACGHRGRAGNRSAPPTPPMKRVGRAHRLPAAERRALALGSAVPQPGKPRRQGCLPGGLVRPCPGPAPQPVGGVVASRTRRHLGPSGIWDPAVSLARTLSLCNTEKSRSALGRGMPGVGRWGLR